MFRRPRPTVTNTAPPADIIAPGPVHTDNNASRLLEAEARMRHAAELVEHHLWTQSMRFADDRNDELGDVLLELHSTPAPVGAEPAGACVMTERGVTLFFYATAGLGLVGLVALIVALAS